MCSKAVCRSPTVFWIATCPAPTAERNRPPHRAACCFAHKRGFPPLRICPVTRASVGQGSF
eukprot:4424477-Pyramimonas_sp.AAC.2